MKKKLFYFVATMILNTSRSFEDENKLKIDWSTIFKLIRLLFVILIIFTIIYFMCLGCLLVLNSYKARAPQTVTLSSEGPANEMYPDSMGEYQLAEEVIQGWDADYTWYRHKDREDRFLMYNNLGKKKNFVDDDIFDLFLQIIVGTSPSLIMQRM